MEIEDCNNDRVESVLVTTDPHIAFDNADVVVNLGGYPRAPGMERKDLIAVNAEGMKKQAECLNQYANRNCKVLVVANPCNTNCLVAMKFAPNIPATNFTCLTRLDQDRFSSMVVEKLKTKVSVPLNCNHLRKSIIWGNHSSTQVPDIGNIEVTLNFENWIPAKELLGDADAEQLIPAVQNRGLEVMKAQNASSGLSAANAIAKHLRDWLGYAATPEYNIFSMGIVSDGNTYGIPSGIVFSFPCRFYEDTQSVEIVQGFQFTELIQSMINKTVQELITERGDAEAIVGLLH
jgi:malate dehydrogenase